MTADPITAVAAVVAVGLLGVLIGSFLNVVIWRVPWGESVLRPSSACPRCGYHLRPRDNVPVLSWLVLRGRCRDCGEPISARYPAVELVTGAVFALVALRLVTADGALWILPAYLYLGAIAVALTVIDLDVHRLPNALVLPAYPVVATLLAVASAGTGDWSALVRAAAGGVVLVSVYAVLKIVYPAGMGLGDVKLAGVLGLALGWLGWGTLVVGAFAAFLVGGVYAVGLVVAGRAGRKTGIAFGPWMLAGAAIGVGWGEPLWAAYLGAFV